MQEQVKSGRVESAWRERRRAPKNNDVADKKSRSAHLPHQNTLNTLTATNTDTTPPLLNSPKFLDSSTNTIVVEFQPSHHRRSCFWFHMHATFPLLSLVERVENNFRVWFFLHFCVCLGSRASWSGWNWEEVGHWASQKTENRVAAVRTDSTHQTHVP